MPYKDINIRREYYRWWVKNRGRSSEAKEAQRKYDRERAKLPHRLAQHLEWLEKNPDQNKIWRRKSRLGNRLLSIDYYSNGKNCCECCGEKNIEFLSIDHINGDGAKHRKEYTHRYGSIGDFLVKNNFPKGFRVLCYNCNLSLGFNGYCPHNTLVNDNK